MEEVKIKDPKYHTEIDMREIKLKGDVIDIGLENYGVIYNICKDYDDEIAIEYIMKDEKKVIEKEYYDTAVLFFTLSKLSTKSARKRIIKEVSSYIRDFGEIIIWDINKSIGELKKIDIDVLLPDDKVKNIRIKEINIIKKLSLKNIKNILSNFFDIIEEKDTESVFYIKARKKGSIDNEISIGST